MLKHKTILITSINSIVPENREDQIFAVLENNVFCILVIVPKRTGNFNIHSNIQIILHIAHVAFEPFSFSFPWI